MKLELWPSQEPPRGFADKVLAARAPRRRWPWVAVAIAIIMIATISAWPRTVSGSAAPEERATLQLAGRGVAVAEAGARLRWVVGREARVAQDAGDVFYRVEHGGPFRVSAAGVDVDVTGTCFRVEVQPMFLKMAGSAAAGAAVASVVLISVYEGSVKVTGAGASRDVAAGEQVRAGAQAQPQLVTSQTPPALLAATQPASAQATREELAQRAQQDQVKIAALQARVKQLETEHAQQRSFGGMHVPYDASHDEEPGPDGLPPRNKFHDFTPAELQAMADHCEVRIDIPPLSKDTWTMPPDLGARLHLSEDEQAKAADAVNAVRVDAIAHLRALYTEVTGDTAGANNLDPNTIGMEILHKAKRDEIDAARAKVAREKAGIDPPPQNPDSGTPPERYFRFMTTLGDSLQKKLEPALGVQGAGSARDQLTPSKMTMNGCNDPQR